jgi:hypothetical protein
MATTILERDDLAVTRHVGVCGGCGARTLETRAPTYQLTAKAAMDGQPQQWGCAYICLCRSCVTEAYQAVERDRG